MKGNHTRGLMVWRKRRVRVKKSPIFNGTLRKKKGRVLRVHNRDTRVAFL
jgi:hypothetical protein